MNRSTKAKNTMSNNTSAVPSTVDEVRAAYNENASTYALVESIPEYLGLRRIRRRLIQQAESKVLEVAVGTGLNLPYYASDCRLTAVDISEAMLERAERRAESLGLQVDFRQMKAEELDFPDNHFDTIVSTMTLCTFIEPVKALREMSRVCKPDGRILLMEHGRSSTGPIARFQDRWEEKHAEQMGCHWNREPVEIAQEAGLELIQAQTHFFGVFHEIVARPAPIPEDDVAKASNPSAAQPSRSAAS